MVSSLPDPGAPHGPATDENRRLARQLKALSHPARLAIVRILAERNECVCGDLVADLPLAQSTVSQHLKALKEAGLVQGTVEGRRTCYCLNPGGLSTLKGNLDAFFADVDPSALSPDNG